MLAVIFILSLCIFDPEPAGLTIAGIFAIGLFISSIACLSVNGRSTGDICMGIVGILVSLAYFIAMGIIIAGIRWGVLFQKAAETAVEGG
jgi:hypothetical protein